MFLLKFYYIFVYFLSK